MNNTCEYSLVFTLLVNDENRTYEEKDKRRVATLTFDQRDRESVEKVEYGIFEILSDDIRRMYNDNKGNERN